MGLNSNNFYPLSAVLPLSSLRDFSSQSSLSHTTHSLALASQDSLAPRSPLPSVALGHIRGLY